jgi:hypothetical protein
MDISICKYLNKLIQFLYDLKNILILFDRYKEFIMKNSNSRGNLLLTFRQKYENSNYITNQ